MINGKSLRKEVYFIIIIKANFLATSLEFENAFIGNISYLESELRKNQVMFQI